MRPGSDLAGVLERGGFDGVLARACAAAWGRVAALTLVRRLALPEGARVVAVGGATLGGSGKTPLAIACAAELAASGARVALVGHAYRATPGRARIVGGDAGSVARPDPIREVGDEALLAARVLSPAGVRVVVAPRRSAAIALAARHADVLVLDGVAQTAPVRATLALLAVDGSHPWGAGAVPPRGDLRAPRQALRRACDAIVVIGDPGDSPVDAWPGPAWTARVTSAGAEVGGALQTWADLSRERVGLLCVLARADRLVRRLERHGVEVRAVVRARDHGPVGSEFFARAARAEARAGVALWLATPKCALHLAPCVAPEVTRDVTREVTGDVANAGRPLAQLVAPIGVLQHSLALGDALRERLLALAVP